VLGCKPAGSCLCTFYIIPNSTKMTLQLWDQKSPPKHVIAVYVFFLGLILAMHHLVANGEFSSIMTMSVMIRCLGSALLTIQSVSSGSAAGISARALGLDAFALCCQLSSTLWLQGYLPVDASGDWVFQTFEVCTLMLVVGLLYHVLLQQKDSYQAEADSCPAVPLLLLSFILAVIFHADLNERPVFDTLWMTGLFADVVAVLPQLWLIARTGGRAQALTSHYIAAMACSRVFSGLFMWAARDDITCVEWISGFNHGLWAILGAHVLHFVFIADFGYYYMKAITTKGLASSVDMGDDAAVWV